MTDNLTEKDINYTFKLLYAIGIILIVCGHSGYGGFSLFYEFFPPYAFHIALFVFASGYFYNAVNELNVRNFILKKTKKLIIPLYMWNLVYLFVLLMIMPFGFFPDTQINLYTFFISPMTDGHQFVLNSPCWFIAPLFMVHILNICVRKIFRLLNININEILFFIVSLSLGFWGVWLANQGLNTGGFLVLTRILYFLPFYSLCTLYRKYENYDKINNFVYFSVIIAAALCIIYCYGGEMPEFLAAKSEFFGKPPFLPFLTGILGVAFWLRISKILTPVFGQNKYVNILADSTYTIMIVHFTGIMLVKSVYAFLYKYTALCSGFDLNAFKTDLTGYLYVPHNLSQFLILYVIAGLLVPVFIQKIINTAKQRINFGQK